MKICLRTHRFFKLLEIVVLQGVQIITSHFYVSATTCLYIYQLIYLILFANQHLKYLWCFCTEKFIRNAAYFKKNFTSTFVSYKGSSWKDSCFHLLQILLFPAWSINDTFKKIYPVIIFVTSCLSSLFKLLFSKYVLKNLAPFLTSKKLAENINMVFKRIFFLYVCCYIHNENISFLGPCHNPFQKLSYISVDFQCAFCMTQRLNKHLQLLDNWN